MGGGAYHESLEKLSKKSKELHRAIQSLIEELEAIDWYQQRVDATEDDELREILAHKTYLFSKGKITEIEEEKD